MSSPVYRVIKLTPRFDLRAFDCGEPAYNDLLVQHAVNAVVAGSSMVYRIAGPGPGRHHRRRRRHERGPSRRAETASDLGGDTGNRTPDLLLAKQALYQLSYVPEGASGQPELA